MAVGVVVLVGCGGDDGGAGGRPLSAPAPSTAAPTTPSAPSATDAPTDLPSTAAPSASLEVVPPDVPVQLTLPEPSVSFPLDLSSTTGALVDRDGRPFLLHGDAAWSLILQLDLDEVDDYLEARRLQGFNTLVVNLIEHHFADDPPRTVDGVAPFLGGQPFATPNPAYLDHAVEVVRRAAAKGFLVLLTPAYLGYDGGDEGWYQDMVEAGPSALRDYGRVVGERFAAAGNVVWVHGGDFTPPSEGLELVEAVRAGIIAGGATQLETAHWSPETSAADVSVPWLDLNTTYTYGPVHVASRRDERRNPAIAHFLFESAYEQDIKETTPRSIRAQAYDALLSGAIGDVYGHGDIWQFRSTWREALTAQGALDMAPVRALFEWLPWTELVPDVETRLVADGGGTEGTWEFAPAAATPDGATTVVYVPSERDVTVAVSGAGEVWAAWYDPTSARFVPADARLTETAALQVAHPGPNAGSDEDWVLVVRRAGSSTGSG
jgi:hypothetical protein